MTNRIRSLMAALPCVPLVVSPVLAADAIRGKKADPPRPALEAPVSPPAPESRGATIVTYSPREIVPVNTRQRLTTMIVLPAGERILDFVCGDKEYWVIDGNENLAFVKPAKANAETSLNLVAASGNIYSFILREVSDQPSKQPDLKLFVELKDAGMSRAVQGEPAFVASTELKAYRQQIEIAKDETRQVKAAAKDAISSGIEAYRKNMRYPYSFAAGKKPFKVRAMFHDDKFTYIAARSEETPAVYETVDGKPSLVNFDYEDGLYVVRKILHDGYLAIGKQKLEFTSEE